MSHYEYLLPDENRNGKQFKMTVLQPCLFLNKEQ